jgi:phenylacetate-CoA ligase
MSPLFELECWLRRMYRQGLHFKNLLHRLEMTGQLNAIQLEHYHTQHLQRVIRHCYQNVPYYQELFRKNGLKPDDFQTRNDLKKLPYMDKHTVRENFDRLIARKYMNILCRIGSTSGSTGTPGRFLRDYHAINFENAAVWRHWHNAGDNGKKRVTIRGDVIIPVAQNHPPFWRYNPANREWLMSGYHLSLENSRAYIDHILEVKPEVLYCYPSTAYLLAKFFRYHGIKYHFKAIFTSSESLDSDVRQFIEEIFDSCIYDWYGQAERVAAISQCAQGTYHILEDYSLVELLETANGHELVGTHLFNLVMPLLRYRTGDYVQAETSGCSCGSSFRTVEKILGRNYNYIVTPEGYRISIINHIPRGVKNLIETQFYQDKPGEVVLRVITNGRFTEQDKALLVKNTLKHTSPSMKVIVKEVNELPRGPNGKFISIVNKLELMN